MKLKRKLIINFGDINKTVITLITFIYYRYKTYLFNNGNNFRNNIHILNAYSL